MTSTANDIEPLPGGSLLKLDMTVFTLTAFLCVCRAREPLCIDTVSAAPAGWFECAVPFQCAPVAKMASQGRPFRAAGRLKASIARREVTRTLPGGIDCMVDQGAGLIIVAFMMTALRLKKGKLGGGPCQWAPPLAHITSIPAKRARCPLPLFRVHPLGREANR